MAYGNRVLGYVAMSYEDLVAEYREAYWALQNLALPRLRLRVLWHSLDRGIGLWCLEKSEIRWVTIISICRWVFCP